MWQVPRPFWPGALQVAAAIALIPSTAYAARGTPVSFTIGTLAGLTPYRSYSFTLQRADDINSYQGCMGFGYSDENGVLQQYVYASSTTISFSAVGAQKVVFRLYTDGDCYYTERLTKAIVQGVATVRVSPAHALACKQAANLPACLYVHASAGALLRCAAAVPFCTSALHHGRL